jgi:L-threonylcarbamoyladenylate synthase
MICFFNRTFNRFFIRILYLSSDFQKNIQKYISKCKLCGMKAEIGKDLLKAVFWLKSGFPVAIPTETVYGLAANAFSEEAVVKIFEAKERPFFDPLIVHIGKNDTAGRFVRQLSPIAQKLAERFWPGPLTLILPKKDIIPDIVTAGQDTVGIRMPDHKLTQELLSILDFPLAAPSANPFGYISPTSASHVFDQLGDKIPYILDGGVCTVGLESTIIGFDDETPVVYRLGGISIEKIESVTGKLRLNLNQSSNPAAPGQLKSHYAPHKPVYIGEIDDLVDQFQGKAIGTISFRKPYLGYNILKNWILSDSGDLDEAAVNLFHALREADQSDAEIILAEIFPDKGLGRAINDRLKRASNLL